MVGNRSRKPGHVTSMRVRLLHLPPEHEEEAPVGELAYPLRSERRVCGFESHPGYQAGVVFNGSTGAFQAHGTSSNLVVRSSSLKTDATLPGRSIGRTRGSEPRDQGSNPCRVARGRGLPRSSLKGRARASGARGSRFESEGLDQNGPGSSNGRTPVLQAGDGGSIPSPGTTMGQ